MEKIFTQKWGIRSWLREVHREYSEIYNDKVVVIISGERKNETETEKNTTPGDNLFCNTAQREITWR